MGAQHSGHKGLPKLEPLPAPYDPSKIITRDQWGAVPGQVERFAPLKHPLKKVRVVYTHTDPCYNVNQCSRILRELQEDHMWVGCPDIMHNFLVGADGNIYEGRGWDHESCAMQGQWVLKGRTLDIGFIGPYLEMDVPENMIKTAKTIVLYGIKHKYLTEDVQTGTVDHLGDKEEEEEEEEDKL
ncbi:peptidoglycan-recognition protein SB2-like [Macrosteles quadrilineatus]|uniref:peptidoglycan-recognition protein SB2-like n=1 Tax=Macrosteles quadrilineatus TaxID=74068 RepID=UPI0023E17355|nr:peptidoglycan-recognition protein SB2-like [Macrosteles quadrilineatus]